MSSSTIATHRFSNGLTFLTEQMPWLESAAINFLVPAGCQRDPVSLPGLAKLTAEMIQRGCGDLPSREFEQALDQLGIVHSCGVSNYHIRFGAAMPADRLSRALPLYADLLRRPHLPEQQLNDGQMVCIQDLLAMEDDLSQKLMQQLRHRQYPDPLGRSPHGKMESLHAITIDDIQQFYQQFCVPDETIISVAGNIDVPALTDQIESLLGDWQGANDHSLPMTPPPRGNHHIQHDSSQTQIGIVFPSVAYSHPDYFQARGAIGVLSDGMSSRLFTEVREKRGLCYTVFAMCHTLRDHGCVLTYAGTTCERAQETLDVLIVELQRLGDGIEQTELDRLKAKIKTGLIMQQESSSSRAASMAADWHLLGKVRQTHELAAILDDLSVDSINAYLSENRPSQFRVVTLGQNALEIPAAGGGTL